MYRRILILFLAGFLAAGFSAFASETASPGALDAPTSGGGLLAGFERHPHFEEQQTSFTLEPGMHVAVNAPLMFDPARPTRLIFYALPNGNVTAHAIGRKSGPGQDARFASQHIGAQTRRLRQLPIEENVVVVYVEAQGKSWPAWRKEHADGPARIAKLVETVAQKFADYKPRTTLSAHSGGGSFIWGYLNSVERIPASVERIAFLDANYSYSDEERHGDKLLAWLKADSQRYLCVIAYDDRHVALEGKPLVGPEGGTWRATERMARRFEREMELSALRIGDIVTSRGLEGRVQFVVHANPKNVILHSLLTAKNGFLHAMHAGSPNEKLTDSFFGEVVYGRWIEPN